MPRKPMPWFRFYVEAIHDRKLRRQDPAVRWLWVAILAVARQSPTPGALLLTSADDEGEPVEIADLVDAAAVDEATVRKGLDEFERLGMLEHDGRAWLVAKWGDRQFDSDDVTSRTRKHRSKEQGRNVPTSFQGTAPETETEKPTHKRARARARRPLPDGWEPNDTHRTIAAELDRDLTRETADFTDDATANDRRYKDWDAAFRKWLRNERYRPPAAGNGMTLYTAAEQKRRRQDAEIEQALTEQREMGLP